MPKQLTIKNSHKEKRLFRKRIVAVCVIILVLFLLLFFRLLYLQFFQHKHFTTLSANDSIKLLPINPTRGVIYDRNGVILAKNIPVFSLMLTPDKVKDLNKTINGISKIIELSGADLEEFYKQLKQHRQFEEIPLKLKLSDKDLAVFEVNAFKFPGVSVEAGLLREYPFGDALAHVVGYVGRINTTELHDVDQSNYAATNFIGKVGIEKYYESELHGQVGYQKVEIDAGGRIVRTLSTTAPVRGDDLYLTIDSRLQQVAKDAMENRRGSVVAIDPSNGQVLALVSTPAYDPNSFVNGISREDYAKLAADPKKPLYNRSIRGLYPPGSTIKPFIGLAGLGSDTVTPDYKIFDPGWFQLPNSSHIYHDWKRGGHGWTNITKAIIESCDTYFYNLADQMGISKIDDLLDQFGFGQLTGIDMAEELAGIVPSPKWKFKHVGSSWYPGDTVITGIGQGYMLATPLQLADATATLAENGERYKPALLYALKSPNSPDERQQPIPEEPVIVDNPKDWEVIIQAMEKVITEGTGGYRFGIPKYTAAAKTGTAQVISRDIMDSQAYEELPKDLRTNSVFIAFAPVAKPKIAVAVVVEHSFEAPAIARKVMDAYMLGKHAESDTSNKDEKISVTHTF